VRVAGGAGLPTTAWITDMNQVLGSTCGNALEVKGQAPEPRGACAELLLGGLATDDADALQKVDHALQSGQARTFLA
jgi:thymidine phosphorylase